MTTQAYRRAAVVGATAWGTTLAVLLARNGVAVTLLARSDAEANTLEEARVNERRLPGVQFPEGLTVRGRSDALAGAELVCFVVPSQTLAASARDLAHAVPEDALLLSASKGIETDSGRRMSEVLYAELPGRSVATLSGPNLSREIAAGLPSTTVVASADAPLDRLRGAFHGGALRVYTSEDIVGVEFGVALKNIYAIAAGMVDAFGYGDNAKAAIVTRGLAEMTRLGTAAGANPLTFQGLAGIGDLMATSYSPLSRNRRLGELVARGASTPKALAALGETAEGVTTTPAALRLARRLGVEMPIAEGLQAVLHGGLSPQAAVQALLEREPKPER